MELLTPEQTAQTIKKWKETIKFFNPSEFDSPDMLGSGINMNFEFIKILDNVRRCCDFPFTINSGFRTKEHNKKVAKVEDSAHTSGYACDVKIENSSQRLKIFDVARAYNISRIGIAKTFVHIDIDPDKPQNVIWLY